MMMQVSLWHRTSLVVVEKNIIQRHKLYIKIQYGGWEFKMAAIGHLAKQVGMNDLQPLNPKTIVIYTFNVI